MRVPGNSSASSLFTSSSASAVAASAALSAVSSTAFTSSTASAAAVASSAAAVASSLTAAQHPAEASATVVVERNPYALVLALIPVLTIFGKFFPFKNSSSFHSSSIFHLLPFLC